MSLVYSRRRFVSVAVLASLTPLEILAQKVPKPEIVSRKGWGAREPRKDISTYAQYGLRPSRNKIITLHNTARGAGSGIKAVRAVQDFEMDELDPRFSDVGYNFLIDSQGTIYEGRLLSYIPSHAGKTAEANATHEIAKDPDYDNVGIAFLADSNRPLTQLQVNSAIALVKYLQSVYNIGKIFTHAEIKQEMAGRGLTPIGDYNPLVCPGSGTIEEIIQIRNAVDFGFDARTYRALFRQ